MAERNQRDAGGSRVEGPTKSSLFQGREKVKRIYVHRFEDHEDQLEVIQAQLRNAAKQADARNKLYPNVLPGPSNCGGGSRNVIARRECGPEWGGAAAA